MFEWIVHVFVHISHPALTWGPKSKKKIFYDDACIRECGSGHYTFLFEKLYLYLGSLLHGPKNML
jgi:hypothetical protein